MGCLTFIFRSSVVGSIFCWRVWLSSTHSGVKIKQTEIIKYLIHVYPAVGDLYYFARIYIFPLNKTIHHEVATFNSPVSCQQNTVVVLYFMNHSLFAFPSHSNSGAEDQKKNSFQNDCRTSTPSSYHSSFVWSRPRKMHQLRLAFLDSCLCFRR